MDSLDGSGWKKSITVITGMASLFFGLHQYIPGALKDPFFLQ